MHAEKNQTTPQIFDLALSTDWEYDRDFIDLLEKQAREQNLKTYVIWAGNLDNTYEKLRAGRIKFRFLFDRASDTTPDFYKIQDWMLKNHGQVFESLEELNWASDKATMHLEFIANGLYTPYTVILPPYNDIQDDIKIPSTEQAALGNPFIIKPANTTGGGRGVVDGATTFQEICDARKNYPADKYLIQEKVKPLERDGYRFWFRGFFACGLIQVSWWHDLTRLYKELTTEEVSRYGLEPLYTIIENIAGICRLKFFSTEMALLPDNRLVVVDYVNESSDMRLKSKAADGVPDHIVRNNARQIVRYIQGRLHA
ncbi:MAG: hypothetical protein JSW33_03765 [bacterium]|nr:MAG: hypothetical protein JSW33_03765 [bacterium]